MDLDNAPNPPYCFIYIIIYTKILKSKNSNRVEQGASSKLPKSSPAAEGLNKPALLWHIYSKIKAQAAGWRKIC